MKSLLQCLGCGAPIPRIDADSKLQVQGLFYCQDCRPATLADPADKGNKQVTESDFEGDEHFPPGAFSA